MICCFKGNFRITSPRGERVLNGRKEFHKGIDMVGMDDITVYSVCEGVATTGFEANGAGNYIVVTMSDGRRVLYMHLAKFLVTNGKKVKKGEPIGIMGNTGNSYGAHTHIELRKSGETIGNGDTTIKYNLWKNKNAIATATISNEDESYSVVETLDIPITITASLLEQAGVLDTKYHNQIAGISIQIVDEHGVRIKSPDLQNFVLTNGHPYNADIGNIIPGSAHVSTVIYFIQDILKDTAFRDRWYGLAAAASIIYALIVGAISGTQQYLTRDKKSGYKKSEAFYKWQQARSQ